MELLITVIFSGLLSSIITQFVIFAYQNRKIKIDLIKLISGKSFMITQQYSDMLPNGTILKELSEALNQIWIVFNKSKDVLNARKEISDKEVSPELLFNLISAMCNDAKFNIKKVDPTLITAPIIIRKK